MRMRMIIGDDASAGEWLRAVADIAIVMLPAMQQHGIATSADVGRDTIAERLLRQVASGGGIVIGRAEVGVWSKSVGKQDEPVDGRFRVEGRPCGQSARQLGSQL
jgi:hypothetical protein